MLAVLCVAVVAQLGDVGGAFWVDGDRGRGHQRDGAGGHFDVEDGAVERVELFELGGEGARRSAAGGEDGFGLGVHVDGEHAEVVEVRHDGGLRVSLGQRVRDGCFFLVSFMAKIELYVNIRKGQNSSANDLS